MSLRPLLATPGGLGLRGLSTFARRPHPSHVVRSLPSRPSTTHRTFFTSTLTALSEAVGSTPLPGLLAASPVPLWASIVGLALTVRLGITFPLQLWQRRRVWRARKFVVPEMKRINDELAVQMAVQSKREGLTYEKYRERLKAELATRQAALHKKHGTHPTTTMLVPLAVSVPLFIVMSMTIRQAVTTYPELAAQSFLWVEHMGLPDKQWILPMVAGLLGFGNAENASVRYDARKEAAAAAEAPSSSPPSSTPPPSTPSSSPSTRPSPPPSTTPPWKQTRKFSTTPAQEDKHTGPQHFGKRRVAAKPRAVAQIPGAPKPTLQPMRATKVKGPKASDMVEETHWAARLLPQNREWVQKALTTTLRGASFLVIVVGLQMPAVSLSWACESE
ncbi:hypothetical protein CC85DRAFT_285814 [Cutaneotrichosporon oleaginosum]|uniref:Uncharacterized protein n=1 Tax=Cutaneotrichosporon oleaginosum TaxID=879819 RepID=A0A0J1B363_9TREE|nr:uncharacterized protein CC85DRAFT_285814 [Cutaneotrichosporon oleaginosum]KLT42049.1 hypothetical protein CC85DRAFT_285814 [Cutaneotrichosporon oleaginosum]TXT04712.1 hypothetical protein COLE_07531 [Cutaneotrichosporon oleaginosum]